MYPKFKHCVWLSVCIAIHFINEDHAAYLLSLMKGNEKNYHNLYLWKEPKCGSNSESTQRSCRFFLAHSNLPWRLEKIKRLQLPDHNNFILEESKQGIFICLLCPTDKIIEHTVTINVEKKEIYDCEEDGVMKLTRESLDRCCGKGKTFLRFENVYQLINTKDY